MATSFDALRICSSYHALRAAMAENSRSTSSASAAVRLGSARVPEDIDYDAATTTFFIGTVLGQQS